MSEVEVSETTLINPDMYGVCLPHLGMNGAGFPKDQQGQNSGKYVLHPIDTPIRMSLTVLDSSLWKLTEPHSMEGPDILYPEGYSDSYDSREAGPYDCPPLKRGIVQSTSPSKFEDGTDTHIDELSEINLGATKNSKPSSH